MKKTNIFLTISIATNILYGQSDFLLLQKKYTAFNSNICKFPTYNNTIPAITKNNLLQEAVIKDAKNTHIIIDDKTIDLCNTFIVLQQKSNNNTIKSLYHNMTLSDFIIRLIEKRPLVFMNNNDVCKLRTFNAPLISMDFTKIGTLSEQNPLVLSDYLSYDEMKIAALIGIICPTNFINNGRRNNSAIIDPPGTFQSRGLYAGLVGARFEKENFMEWQDIIITKEQNTEFNGYGLTKCNQGLLKIWSDFYECKFPTYDEALADTTEQYTKHDQHFFNTTVYKKRIECVIKPFLNAANNYGKEHNKKVYIHTVGLGLGVWAVLPKEQTKCIIEAHKNIIKTNAFPYINDINFSWFDKDAPLLVPTMSDKNICLDQKNNPITIHFSTRNPADKLIGIDTDKLLVANYAWDGNAYPGNEFWAGMLTATGDPAAACCSLIATLQNILINPWLKENIITEYGPTSTIMQKAKTIHTSPKPKGIANRLKHLVNSALNTIGYNNFFNLQE